MSLAEHLSAVQYFVAKSPMRFHGNGFIQVQLGQATRLHIWAPAEFPGIPNHNADIHDHIFDLTSTVLHGSLVHTTYESVPVTGIGQYYTVSSVEASKENKALPSFVELYSSQFHVSGRYVLNANPDPYFFAAQCFHSSSIREGVPLTMTLFKKQDPLRPTATSPRVLSPFGEKPINAFDHRYSPKQSVMADYVNAALEQLEDWAVHELYKYVEGIVTNSEAS